MDDFDKFIAEHGDRSITISLSQLGILMGQNITRVVSIEDLMCAEDSVDLEAHVALLELLILFCSRLLEDIYDDTNLEIETDGGNT